jgi:putative DNA primase/helicase
MAVEQITRDRPASPKTTSPGGRINESAFYSRYAEAAVIGSMIMDSECIDAVASIIGPDSFYFPENRIVYQAILDVRESHGTVDGLLVRDALEDKNLLARIGRLTNTNGLDYLTRVVETTPGAANAEHYARLVHNKAVRRRIGSVAEQVFNVANSHEDNAACISRIKALADNIEDCGAEATRRSRAVLKNLSAVEAMPIEWFWYNRVPLGMLTLLLGDPGLGKSFLSLYMASKVSTGDCWPDNSGEPGENRAPKGSVVILTAEDDLQRVVRPRLDNMGADVSRIISIEAVRLQDGRDRPYEDYFRLSRDADVLKQVLTERKDVRLVIIDPLSAYLGSGVDSHKDADVRGVLMPLVELAQSFNAAVLGIVHMNKNVSSKAVYRALGSIAFTASARTVWLVTTDPNNPKSTRRLLLPAKHNVLINPTGLAFEIADSKVVFETEPVTLSADEALEQKSSVASPEKDRAVEWLREILAAGEMRSTELQEMALQEGISRQTLKDARKQIGMISYPVKQPGGNSAWFVRLSVKNSQNKAKVGPYSPA